MYPPPPSASALPRRSRHSSFTDNDPTPLATSRARPEMTYFMADESSMNASISPSPTLASRPKPPTKRDFGVESLDTTISSLASLAASDSDDHDSSLGRAREAWKKNLSRDGTESVRGDGVTDALQNTTRSRSPSPKSYRISRDTSPAEIRLHRPALDDNSRPVTPAYLQSPLLGSTPGSPISRIDSEMDFMTDDAASQAIMSGGEDEDAEEEAAADNAVMSQLVMPSLSLPQRKPFTEKGKSLGKLKIMIAGDSGIGKTSLIKAIAQACEDIVHVDELSSTPLSASEIKGRSRPKSSRSPMSTSQITEVYASTRAYPTWWSELDDVKVLRRRKSMGDSVLERNLCFVDTPGYGNGTSFMECVGPVVQYLESHLERSSSMSMTDSELITMMGGSGGSQVDVVFYLIHQRIKKSDLDYLQRISPLTNIIPIIAKADVSKPECLQALKANTLSQLAEAQIRPFLFGNTTQSALEPGSTCPPWTISTLAGTDPDNMDASLLMSPDYVSPLLPSQLSELVSGIFDRDSISWLRHSTAKKYIQYRGRSTATHSHSLPQSLAPASLVSSTFSLVNPSQIITPPLGATSSYSLARITDHTNREEQLAQVRLSNWAADLQRSLQNERLRFEALARGERAVWLTERLNECVQDGTLVPVNSARTVASSSTLKASSLAAKGSYSRKKAAKTQIRSMDRADPLGLVKLNEEMQRRSWAALQIVGSFGILGGLAWWWSRGGWSSAAATGIGMGSEGEGSASWSLVGEWSLLGRDW